MSQCPTSKGCWPLVQRPWPNRQPPATTSTVLETAMMAVAGHWPFKGGTHQWRDERSRSDE
jgi:hypothetical protein